jgi:hypothetical protein
MKANIDFDWAAYAFGNATDDEYKPLAWPFVKSRIDGTIRKILEATEADEHQLYITSNDKSNFRFEVATIKPYKGNRPSEKPYYYDRIRDYLVKGKGAIEVFGMEADDAVSIAQYKDLDWFGPTPLSKEHANTVLCTIDKDLDNVPGWHYNWMKDDEGVYWIDELSGIAHFYCQLLTGDGVDNILGLFGVGKSSKLLATVREYDNEFDMYLYVRDQYHKRFGSYADQFLLENARLLYMLEEEGVMWVPPEKPYGKEEESKEEEVLSE